MNSKFTNSILILLALLLSVASCSKDPAPVQSELLPVRIEIKSSGFEVASRTTCELGYDKSGRMTKIRKKTEITTPFPGQAEIPSETETDVSIVYGTAGEVIREEIHEILIFETRDPVIRQWSNSYTYKENTVECSTDGNIYTLDERGVAVNLYWNCALPGEDPRFTSVLYHYDKQGNFSSEGPGYRYDHKKGIFQSVNMPRWYMTTQAPASILGFGHLVNNIMEDHSHIYRYKYNSAGYPDSFTSSTKPGIMDGGNSHFTITYKQIYQSLD